MILVWAIVGALLNRIRGGLFGLPRWLTLVLLGGSYALLCFSTGVPYYLAALSGVLLALAWIPGHGEYVGSLGGIKGYWHTEDYDGGTYDFIADLAVGHRRLWGFLGLLTKGLGMSLAMVPALQWYALPVGALLPVCYFVGVSLEQIIMKRDSFVWSEVLHGAVVFGLSYSVLS